MITEELIDELVQRFNGWNRSGEHGVLRYISAAHEILMTAEAEQNLIFNETTGVLPSLNTVAGTFRYILTNDVWRVASILIKITDAPVATDYGALTRSSYKNSRMIGGILYAKVPYVRQWDYINSVKLARLMFTQDPGTHNDYYFRESYKRPTEILSESIQVDIPSPLDFDILIPAAAKLIEGVQSGNYDQARQYVKLQLKPELWKQLNSGVQGELDMEPVDRGF